MIRGWQAPKGAPRHPGLCSHCSVTAAGRHSRQQARAASGREHAQDPLSTSIRSPSLQRSTGQASEYQQAASTPDPLPTGVPKFVSLLKSYERTAYKDEALAGAVFRGLHRWRQPERLQLLQRARIQNLVDVCWGLARLPVQDDAEHLLHSLAMAILPARVHELSPQEAVRLLWALTRHGSASSLDCSVDLTPLVSAAASGAHQLRAPDLRLLLPAAALALPPGGKHSNFALLQPMCDSAARQLNRFDDNGVCSLLVACIDAGCYCHGPLVKAAGTRAIQGASTMSPACLSSITWAFAQGLSWHPPLYAALADVAAARLPELSPRHLTSILWSFSTAGFHAPTLFRQAVPHILSQLPAFSPQDLSLTCLAYARLSHYHPGESV